jgi:Spy/CpxP family protein refolding chaperone
MNKRLFTSLAVAGTLAMAAPLLTSAQPADQGGNAPDAAMMHKHEMHRGHHMRGGEQGGGWMGRQGGEERMLRGLHLTEAQRDQVFALRHEQAPKMREQGKVVRDAYRELRTLTMSDGYDDAKAKAISERGAQAIAQMAQLRAHTGNEIYKLLTPEQRQKLADRAAHGGEGGHWKKGGHDKSAPAAPAAETRS